MYNSRRNRKTLKIAIFGAGVGGLSSAHLLAPFHEVEIYEARDSAGGLARTEGSGCSTREISWRVYFHFYKHLFSILQDIPSFDGRTVMSHLRSYDNITLPNWNLSNLSISVIFKILKLQTFSSERLYSYDSRAWHDYLGSDFAQIPQWLGLDRFLASTNSVQRIGIEQSFLAKGSKDDFVFDGPTNEVWFDPWVKELRKRYVKLNFQNKLEYLSIDKYKNIKHAIVRDQYGNRMVINADIYILSLPVEEISRLASQLVPNSGKLRDLCWQIQLAFQLHLEYPLSLGMTSKHRPILSFTLSNSPWSLIVEAKNISWNYPDCATAQWSATACQYNVPGLLGKSLMECQSEEEVKEEIKAQLEQDEDLIDYLKKNNPRFDGNLRIKWWGFMGTYKFGPNGLQTNEPKFSNNAGSRKLRPSARLGPNSLIATAYNKEAIDIFSMEAAAMGSYAAVSEILGTPKPEQPKRPLGLLNIIRFLDSFLFKLGLPDPLTLSLYILAVIFLAWFSKNY